MKMSLIDDTQKDFQLPSEFLHPIQIENDTSKSSMETSFAIEMNNDKCSSMLESKDVCEELLGNKMTALELTDITNKASSAGDGSDSGVDIATSLSIGLQRALSSNSGGYASSCCGLDDAQIGGNLSCDSSMISYSSDIGDNKTASTVLSQNSNHECTSENGSESSSIAGGPTMRKASVVKKKVNVNEPSPSKSPRKTDPAAANSPSQLNKIRARTTSVNRSIPTAKTSCAPILQTRERARSREKTSTTPSSKSTTPPYRSTPVKRPQKPDTLPSPLITSSSSIQRISGIRTPSVARARTPGTPTDDGRWPSVGGRGVTMTPRRGGSAAPDLSAIKSRINMLSFEAKTSSVLDKYATLPRRRKQKSVEDLRGRSSRSSSASRDNKMTSSTIVSTIKKLTTTMTPSRELTPSKMLPPFPKLRKQTPKTKIYHETSVQTAITSKDVENAFAGAAKSIQIDAIELADKETQSDIRDKEIESLKEQIRYLTDKHEDVQFKLSERTQMLVNMEHQLNREREEKLLAQRELHLNTERVIGMLELARGTPTDDGGCDSLLMLESQIQMSGHELEEKQEEISKLRNICRTLQTEMERSLSAQQFLIQEKATIEKESYELQDFLQNEKTAMYDALKDAETEYQECKKKLDDREAEVKILKEECRHLVRVNEQRRQENKGMQSKYTALESRSKDLIVQQGTAVSGASMALSGLNSRLDSLVEQLISSYHISEQDLEDVVFHNEAYTNSGSSGDGSPEYETVKDTSDTNDGSLSPQRNQSFIAAVIGAIKSATTSSKKLARLKKHHNNDDQNEDESDSTEMLDSETEPCLMMDNVLEDVPMPDSHSHNMVSSGGMMISQIEIPSDILHGDDSLANLSQAIANRQQIELQISSMAAQKSVLLRHQSEQSTSDDISGHDSIAEIPSITDYCSAQALVDQVIEVDNLVTKLLKVLRLIQMDNDSCIQQLISDKNKLQLNKEEMLEKLKEWEDLNVKLREELVEASQQLILKGNDISASKSEIQRHRNEIDRLNQDICNLSTLCSQSRQKQQKIVKNTVTKDDLLTSLRTWQEHGDLPEPELISHIIRACNEIPILREKLINTDNNITNNDQDCIQLPLSWQENAIRETKRQYEAIDRALEVLHSIQTIVQQCPALIQLQRDLEETNFKSANTIPMYTALLTAATTNDNDIVVDDDDDINANDSSTNLVGSSGISLSCDNSNNQTQINSPA